MGLEVNNEDMEELLEDHKDELSMKERNNYRSSYKRRL